MCNKPLLELIRRSYMDARVWIINRLLHLQFVRHGLILMDFKGYCTYTFEDRYLQHLSLSIAVLPQGNHLQTN